MYVRLGRYPDDDSERDEQIVIHNYDTWNMDHTLALIILPMLKQLKEEKQGAPNVDSSDVPNYLKPKQMDIVRYREEGKTDENFFKRWDYVMDEMIWAFEQIVDDDNEEQFFSGNHDVKWVPIDENGNEVNETNAHYHRMDRGPKDTFKIDHEGLKKHNDRINNGLMLFGKYYRSLWD